jgi:hypothetical protein
MSGRAVLFWNSSAPKVLVEVAPGASAHSFTICTCGKVLPQVSLYGSLGRLGRTLAYNNGEFIAEDDNSGTHAFILRHPSTSTTPDRGASRSALGPQ